MGNRSSPQTTFCANPQCQFFKYHFSRNEDSTIMIIDREDNYSRYEIRRHLHQIQGSDRTVLLCDACTAAIHLVAGRG